MYWVCKSKIIFVFFFLRIFLVLIFFNFVFFFSPCILPSCFHFLFLFNFFILLQLSKFSIYVFSLHSCFTKYIHINPLRDSKIINFLLYIRAKENMKFFQFFISYSFVQDLYAYKSFMIYHVGNCAQNEIKSTCVRSNL